MAFRGLILTCLGILPLVAAHVCPCGKGQSSCRRSGSLQPIPRSLRVLNEHYTSDGDFLSEQTIAVSFKLRIFGLNASDYGFVYNESSLVIEWIPQGSELFLPAEERPKLFASKPKTKDIVILTLKFPDLLYAWKTKYRLTVFNAFNTVCQQSAVFDPPLTTIVNLDCSKLKKSASCREIQGSTSKCGVSANITTSLIRKHGNWDAEVEVTLPHDIIQSSPTVNIYYGRCNGLVGSEEEGDVCMMDMDTVGVIRFCGNSSEKCLHSFLFQLGNVGFVPYAVQICVGTRNSEIRNRTVIGKRLKLPISQEEGEDDSFPGWKSFVGYGTLITALFILLTYTLAQKYRQRKLPLGRGKEYWEVDESDLEIDFGGEFGTGTFTGVYKGVLKKEARAIADGPVVLDEQNRIAIKIMHINVTDRERRLFVAEIERNKLLGRNARIVNFIGLLAMSPTPGIVLEFCAKGSLKDFLIERRIYMVKLSKEMNVDLEEMPNVRRDYIMNVQKLIRLAFQVCVGLEYLGSQNIIHRDLMAKHVMITADESAKIGQFRHATSSANRSKSLERTDVNALRWMPPEVLRAQHFSHASDVWSLGVIFYEIFTVGGFPYSDVTNCDLLDRLDQGHRLERPPNATHDLYSIMCECWKTEPSDRPSCQMIRERLAIAFDAVDGDPEANRLRIDPKLECYSHNEVVRPRKPNKTDSTRSSMRRGGSLPTRASIRSAVNESERLLGFTE